MYLSWAFIVIVLFCALGTWGQFQWQSRDAFDEIRLKMAQITPDNCHIKSEPKLFLDFNTVSHVPDIKDITINPVFPNRTALLHIHNMALSRAFFYSFILHRAYDDKEPGFMYYYLSAIADVAANTKLNSSAIYFSPNMSFTPSFKGFFNKTLPLFAPRAFRSDDYNDPIHLQRISTLRTLEAGDLGAFRRDIQSLNYTTNQYRINEWYKLWLPDRLKRQDSKTTYSVHITHANGTNETFVWHGPPGADEKIGPVKWTRPYFDCGRSNKWVIAATVPIPDIYPRHTQFRHIEYPTYVGVSVMETDFDRIDINQCPIGDGNPGPNKFAGTHHCKEDTTECEPLHGYGFRRGGYQCRCKPGFRLPNNVRQPYLGEIVERATSTEYERLFGCDRIGYLQMMPQNKIVIDKNKRGELLARFTKLVNRTGRETHPERRHLRSFIHNYLRGVTKDNCMNRTIEELNLHGDVAFGADSQFENEARMALRLASFLSGFLQVVDPEERFAELRLADKSISVDQIFGEVIATVMGNVRVWSAGVFWDLNKFPNHTMFAPYAYKKTENTRKLWAEDLSRRKGDQLYLNKHWFKHLKSRWATNADDLEEYILKIKIRANQDGEYATKYDHYPIRYRGPKLSHGYWTAPYFDCGLLNQWVITYAAPFFGWDSIRNKLEFKGVVTTSVLLDKLDINQCSDDYWVQNAFKDSHKCERRSSFCIPILGRGFDTGGYKCECQQGYEFPFNIPFTYFDGQLMEAEYDNMLKGLGSWFDIFNCRIAGASQIQICFIVLLLGLILSLLS